MYTIKVDGQVLYAPALYDDIEHQVLSPRLQLRQNEPGSLEFVIPPQHCMRNAVQVMKSIITVEMGEKEIFRGRATEVTVDMFNQTSVYCEGDLSFLVDSIQRPYEYEGKAPALFTMLIDKHNEQVEAAKRFVVGIVNAVSDADTVKITSDGYTSTMDEITEWLLDQFGGRLRTRFEDGVYYLDYVDTHNANAQPIEFGVNLLDIENQINVQERFTVLIPLGATKNKKPLTIASVNDGKDYIEDAEAIAKYGRICRTQTWDYVTDAAELKSLAEERLRNAATDNTLRITAVDFALLGVDVDKIWIGDEVQITSDPHGVNRKEICIAIDVDMADPKNTEYTFGKIEETLTNKMADVQRASGGGAGSGQAAKYWRQIVQDINEQGDVLSQMSISLDANNNEIKILAESYNGLKTTIEMMADEIELKADMIYLDGYVTMQDFQALQAEVENLWATELAVNSISANNVTAGEGDFDELVFGLIGGKDPEDFVMDYVKANVSELSFDTIHFGEYEYEPKSTTVATGGGILSPTKNLVKVYNTDGDEVTINYLTGVTYTPTTTTLRYLGRKS